MKVYLFRSPIILFSALCILPSVKTASAAVLADYSMDTGMNTTFTAPTEDTNLESLASVLQGYNQAKFSNSTDTAYLFVSNTGSDEASALSNTSYFEFSVTAEAGYELDLDSLVFDLVMGGSNGDPTFSATAYVQADVFGSGLGAGGSVLDSVSGTLDSADNNNTPVTVVSGAIVDLSGLEFQGLSSVTFQFRFSDDSSDASQSDRLDNIILNGTAVAVPEASNAAYAIGLLSALWVVLRRRR